MEPTISPKYGYNMPSQRIAGGERRKKIRQGDVPLGEKRNKQQLK